MSFDHIKIKNLRNIKEGELRPVSGINLIIGSNGSGKTSLIEAVYMLGRGKSFRDKRIGSVVTSGQHALELFGKYITPGQTFRIGISKGRSGSVFRLNGNTLSKLSQLVTEVPIQIITPKSHEILERGPEFRRRLLDWGVFHVEHRYHHVTSRYLRALVQRNAALRTAPEQAAIWNRELGEMAALLDAMRIEYMSHLKTYFQEELSLLLGRGMKVELRYKRGWPENSTLAGILNTEAKSDIRRGFTQYGPHRADLVLKMEGELVAKRASRGQQKLIVCALIFSQGHITKEVTGRSPIIIMDDLASELDHKNRRLLIERLNLFGTQTFITATDTALFEGYGIKKMFHVEHGVVSEQG